MLHRELAVPEVDRMTLNCFLGPVRWLLGPALFPDRWLPPPPPMPPQSPPPRGPQQARRRHIDVPPRGVTAFVPDEILVEVESGAAGARPQRGRAPPAIDVLETQSFTLAGRTLQRWRIDGSESVRATLPRALALQPNFVAQPDFLYMFGQARPPAQSDASAQSVDPKLHCSEAHKVADGDDMLVA